MTIVLRKHAESISSHFCGWSFWFCMSIRFFNVLFSPSYKVKQLKCTFIFYFKLHLYGIMRYSVHQFFFFFNTGFHKHLRNEKRLGLSWKNACVQNGLLQFRNFEAFNKPMLRFPMKNYFSFIVLPIVSIYVPGIILNVLYFMSNFILVTAVWCNYS